ncbi:hypothetical protein DFQ27_004745 [Actinomortierella ambigua]|uniref:Uncharacterized protein n=1 Tax=Actinomortierella ambigua TaxID=1343610 RepID=A0A9P6Q0W8_9FUNG|nr:hypothetical protein DFQ27_004745 [Actinomortierella ambigua]
MPDENEIEAQRSPAPAALAKGTPTLLAHKKTTTDTPPGCATPQKPGKKHAADDSPADNKPLNTITNLAHTRSRQSRQTLPLPTVTKRARLSGSALQRKDSNSPASPDAHAYLRHSKSHSIARSSQDSSESSEKRQLTLKSAFARDHHAKAQEQSTPSPSSTISSSSSATATTTAATPPPSATSTPTLTSATLTAVAQPSDKEVIKSMETRLERYKHDLESAVNQLEQDRAKLTSMVEAFEEEEQEAEGRVAREAQEQQALEGEIETLNQLLETMEGQMDEREKQIKMQQSYLSELNDNVHALEREVYDVLLVEALEEEERLMMARDEEIIILQEKIDETFAELEKAHAQLQEMEECIQPDLVDGLREVLRSKDDYIQKLELQIELEEDSDFVASLNLTVEEELAALKSQYSLTSGSELDKEVTKCQAKLQAKFDRDFARLKQNHTVLIEQTEIKVKSSEKRLATLNASIQEAIESTHRSEQDCAETEKLLEQELCRAKELEQQIRELQQRVATA